MRCVKPSRDGLHGNPKRTPPTGAPPDTRTDALNERTGMAADRANKLITKAVEPSFQDQPQASPVGEENT